MNATDTSCAPPEPRLRSTALWLDLGLLLAAAGLVVLASGRDWGAEHLLPLKGLALVFLCSMPMVRYLRSVAALRETRTQWRSVPFLPLVGVIYAVYFGLPVLTSDQLLIRGVPLPVDSISASIDLALLGWLALLLGFHLLGPRLVPIRALRLDFEPARARRLGLILISLGFLAGAWIWSGSVPELIRQPVLFVQRLMQIGLGILLVLALRGQLRSLSKWLLWLGAVPFWLFLQIGTGSVANLVFSIAFLLLLVWGCGRRVPWSALLLLGLGVVLLRGFASDFREQAWSEGKASAGNPLERSALFVEIVRERVAEQGLGALREAGTLVAERSAQLAILAQLYERTPQSVPYWEGATWWSLPASLIPRFLWPDKPSKELGQRIGHCYGILDEDDRMTSINLPQLAEFFINFGVLGVCLGMGLMGLFYCMLDQLLNRSAADGSRLIAALVFALLLNIESDLSLVLGALLQTVVILVFVLRYAQPVKRPQASVPWWRAGPRPQPSPAGAKRSSAARPSTTSGTGGS